MTPFILRGRKELPAETAPAAQHVYDSHLQVWMDTKENLPLVECLRRSAQPTQFGETTLTDTREGADRTEVASIEASDFGETNTAPDAGGRGPNGEFRHTGIPDRRDYPHEDP